jgi:hypothetical protein
MTARAKPRSLERQLLVFVTLALTFFGLVMVYSATSASAALGNGNSVGYLERQGVYAAIGLVLLVVASRTDFRKLKALAPPLIVTSLVLCAAVLVAGERINGGSPSVLLRSSRRSWRSSRSSSGVPGISRAGRRPSRSWSSRVRSGCSSACSACSCSWSPTSEP